MLFAVARLTDFSVDVERVVHLGCGCACTNGRVVNERRRAGRGARRHAVFVKIVTVGAATHVDVSLSLFPIFSKSYNHSFVEDKVLASAFVDAEIDPETIPTVAPAGRLIA